MANIEALPGIISPRELINVGSKGPDSRYYGSIDLRGGSAEPNAPLAFIPPPDARAHVLGESGDLNTAGHEGLHVIAALNLNVPIDRIVLAPSGNILGATFIGRTSLDKLKKIALAGTMHTLIGGPARGYGSDVMKARVINYIQHGDPDSSLGYEILQAQAVVNQTPIEVQRKFFEMLGFLGKYFGGVVPGSYIGQIMERARWEVSQEASGHTDSIYGFWMWGENAENQDQEKTVLTFREDGYVQFHYEGKNGQILGEEYLICPHCREVMKEKAYKVIGHICLADSPLSGTVKICIDSTHGGGLIYLEPSPSQPSESVEPTEQNTEPPSNT